MRITAFVCNGTAVFSSWPYYNAGLSFLYLQFNNLPLGGVSAFPHVWTDFWVLNSGMKYLFASHVFVSNWIWMNGRTFACKTKLICVCVNLSWEGEMCCLPVHVDTTASICVQLLVFCVCIVCVHVCGAGIKSYLFTERLCLANTSWLPCSWQTHRQLQLAYCFRTGARLLVLERDLGLLMFDFSGVCLISIINDNTAEGRKKHLLPKLLVLLCWGGREQCCKVQQICLFYSPCSLVYKNTQGLQALHLSLPKMYLFSNLALCFHMFERLAMILV